MNEENDQKWLEFMNAADIDEDLRSYIKEMRDNDLSYNKDMRDNDLQYNKEQRENMNIIIINYVDKMEEKHTRDMDILEARIRNLVKTEENKSKFLETRLIKLEEATINHSDILADYLEDRFKKLQAHVDKIAWGLQVLEEKHYV